MAINNALRARQRRHLNNCLMKRANRLEEWRVMQGLTLAQVANSLEVHWQTVYRWETQPVVIPKAQLEKLIKLGFPQEQALVDLCNQNKVINE